MSESNVAPPQAQAALPPPPPIEAAIPPPPPIEPTLPADFQARRVRPLLGPSLWIFGMLLWAQVVFGTFVVAKNMPEPFAALALLVVVTFGWVLSVQLRKPPGRLTLRHGLPLLLALLFWAGAVLFGVVVSALTGAGEGVGFLLWVVGFVAVFVGRRFAGPPRQAATLLRKLLIGLAWVMTVLVTLVAAILLADL